MNETHDSALFIQPEEGVHDGCFLYTKPRCPIKFAQWQAMIEALPVEPSAWFTKMTADMAEIQDVPRPSVIE